MTRIERSALLPYSAQRLFELVDDIETYPQYMEGCIAATIIGRGDDWVEARLELKKAGISQSFATRNRLQHPEKIVMELVDGPFSSFQGEWAFKHLAENACKVSLDLKFELDSKVAHAAAGKLFESVACNLVNALCQRANTLYGK
ncbi:MAG: type II toxin-antitoxin system RatA family toxin [Pseudomonadales bacterium]|nr:type II toxin-antitoxin system RatA family toxin [Pseudomonadales bacterium]